MALGLSLVSDDGRLQPGQATYPETGGLDVGVSKLEGLDNLVGLAPVGEHRDRILKGKAGDGQVPQLEGERHTIHDGLDTLLLEVLRT